MLYKKLGSILYILALTAFVGCAWENLPEGEQEKRLIIQVTMRLGGDMRPDLFYYIVFNLSGDSEKKPYSIFEGEDRGKYWHVYYMWGTPPYRETSLYRGRGGVGVGGDDLIDKEPEEEAFVNEFEPGTVVEGNHMTLRIDLSDLAMPSDYLNMNMIVCNQAIDEKSRLEYEYDPYVFDSFYGRGITINLGSTTEDFWDEDHNPQENLPNEHEDVAPPEADIVGWRFHVVSR